MILTRKYHNTCSSIGLCCTAETLVEEGGGSLMPSPYHAHAWGQQWVDSWRCRKLERCRTFRPASRYCIPGPCTAGSLRSCTSIQDKPTEIAMLDHARGRPSLRIVMYRIFAMYLRICTFVHVCCQQANKSTQKITAIQKTPSDGNCSQWFV